MAQVEQGAVPASAAFTVGVAHVLGVDVDALTGEPFYGPPITDLRAEHAGIPALRAALDDNEDPDFEGFPMPAAALRARLDHCQAQGDNARPSVHDTVHLLAEHDRRATDTLAGFTRWLGITPHSHRRSQAPTTGDSR